VALIYSDSYKYISNSIRYGKMVRPDKTKVGVVVGAFYKNASQPVIGCSCIYRILFCGQIPSESSEQAIDKGIAQTHHQWLVFQHIFYCFSFCWSFYQFAVVAS
jgi:hypothetical protein